MEEQAAEVETSVSEQVEVENMETEIKETFLSQVLDTDDYNSLPENLREKVETAVEEKIDAFLVQEALHLSLKEEHAKLTEKYTLDLEEKNTAIEELRANFEEANTKIATLQEQLQKAEEDVIKANESTKKMHYQWQDFKTQRDLALDEKECLLTMIERRNTELMNLREEKATMSRQLDAAVKAKFVAIENSQEVESLKISLDYKEKRLTEEAELLRSQVEQLNADVESKTMELLKLRRELSTQAVNNESELAKKTEELRIALETVADLKETNQKLTERSEKVLEKLSAQRESYDVMISNFHQELSAQTRLAQLYKDMCTENDDKNGKLCDTIKELRSLLDEATVRYGELETKHNQKLERFMEEIAKRDECIQHLKKELQDANDLLEATKRDNVDAAIGTLSPSAAIASRLLKSGMTLTQIYTQYARVSEELQLEKEENRRLNLYVTTIVNEIEEKAPLLQQRQMDYEKAVASLNSLTHEMDRMITETRITEEECREAKKTSNHLTRENKRLQKQLADLARQVCYLVKAVEEARGGVVHQNAPLEALGNSAQDIISKKLVTFADIEDLQENNQKLLAIVRQLSEKQEAVEGVSAHEYHELQVQKEKLEKHISELLEEMNRQSKMLDLVRSQSDTYKKLYQRAMGNESEAMDVQLTPTHPPKVPSMPSTPSQQEDNAVGKELAEAKETIEKLKEEMNLLRKNKDKAEKELSNKIEKLSSEIRDWMYKNSKLVAKAEYNEEKSKVLEANLKTSKKQVTALEDRIRTLSEICAKHEESIIHLKDQAMEAQSRLARIEVQRDNLQQEVQMLRTAEARLTNERESMQRSHVNNTLLMNHLAGLKAAIDGSESAGKVRLEVQLSEAMKECSALRNSLKEEKDKFKELANSLERQTAKAKERMLEEKAFADKARADLETVQTELEEKVKTISLLNQKIREWDNQPTRSVIQTVSTNLDVSAKRVKELEKQVADYEAEVARLQIQLTAAQNNSKQYAEVAEAAETHLQNLLQESHSSAQVLADKEKEWAEKVKKIEDELQETIKERNKLKMENEHRTRSNDSNIEDISTTLNNIQASLDLKTSELDKARNEIEVLSKELEAAKEEAKIAKQQAAESEARYSQEVVLHSKAIQTLDAVRKEMNVVLENECKLRQERDDAVAALTEKASVWGEQKQRSDEEINSLNARLVDLDEQNRLLHDSLEKLNTELATLQAKVSGMPDSSADMETSLNTSSDLSNKAQEQLMKVIKYLRHEKDITTTRCDVLQAESTRLRAQVSLLQRQLEEANANIMSMKESTQVSEKTSAKHAELARRVESLNAVTDSNRLLREERNRYKAQTNELTEKLKKMEECVGPLRNELKEVKNKIETLTNDNQLLTVEVNRWKARTAQMAERAKASPEDWRRLNNERENLAKQWQAEKNNNEKLEENVKSLRADLTHLNEHVTDLRKKLLTETSEARRLSEEVKKHEQSLAEFEKTKATAAKLQEDLNKANELVKLKEAKELQAQRLARMHQIRYETLSETTKREAEKLKGAQKEAQKEIEMLPQEQERLRAEGRSAVSAQMAELEARTADKLKELQSQITAASEEAQALKKDNETLKSSSTEKEQRAKQAIKNAKNRITQLTEQNKTLEQELNQLRGQAGPSRDDKDSKLNAMKANYDAIIARMEKEKEEREQANNQEREKLVNMNKSLNMRISQIQRTMDKPKPSTSSTPVQKSTMEPPTANIKPMAGSSTARKQKQIPMATAFWQNSSETPFASIRPLQTRTVTVQPTSVVGALSSGSSTTTSSILLPSMQQQVHTTGSTGDNIISSPTSSHTDYMPATSSGSSTPVRMVAPVFLNEQLSQEAEESNIGNEPLNLPQLTVAMVTPRVESASLSPVPGPSSTSSQASSSNTVTTTQAVKRSREFETDSTTSHVPENIHSKSPQAKRSRISGSEVVSHHQVSGGSEVEYQVPTSSQRDQEDDLVIMLVDSEDDGNADDGNLDPDGFEEADTGEGYVESYSRDVQDMAAFEEDPVFGDGNVADGGNNEVEIIEDSIEVPVVVPTGQEQQQQSSEATSSGNDGDVISHSSTSQFTRTRSVPPLNRAQPSLQSYEEVTDDSIVPSTPTLFLPRRGDGGDAAVSSPQVCHQRFTFVEPISGTSRRDDLTVDDSSTGRSVPTTPSSIVTPDMTSETVEPSMAVPQVPVHEMPPPDPTVSAGDGDIRGQEVEESDAVIIDDDSDGVTSEGEKPPATGGEVMEEGREAEASEPILAITNRRVGRAGYNRRGQNRRPTPIVWDQPGTSASNPKLFLRGHRPRGMRRW